MHIIDTEPAHKYEHQGVFVNIKDELDNLPNYKRFYLENEKDVMRFMTAEGNWYNFHNTGIGETNRQCWMYREDIFENHNLAVPTTSEELYDVLKKLKELYPQSYPFIFRQHLIKFDVMGPAWGTGWEVYYNFQENDFRYGPIEDNFKEMAMFVHKLYKEELIPPDWLTMDNNAFVEIVSSGKSFIMLDWYTMIDDLNVVGQETNPDYKFVFMPPIKGNERGVAKLPGTLALDTGSFVVNAKSKVKDEVLKFVDWYYSDEAMDLLSWGEEGVIWETVDGKRKYIDAKSLSEVRQKYGLATHGFFALYDIEATLTVFFETQSYAIKETRKYDLPLPTVALFTSEEQTDIVQPLTSNIRYYTRENLSKMITGVTSFDEWDNYVKELKKLGVDDLVEMYREAYKRLEGN